MIVQNSLPADFRDTRGKIGLRSILAIAGGVWLALGAGAILMRLPPVYVGAAFLLAAVALVIAILPRQGQLARARRAMRRAHWRHHLLTGMGYEDLRLNAWNDYIAAWKDVARHEAACRTKNVSARFR